MPANISIKLTNAKQIQDKLRKMPMEMTKQLDTAVRRTLALVQNNTMREAPVNKQSGGGNLRQSITTTVTGVASGKLTVESSYGVFVHEGTAPHTIRPSNKKALANTRMGKMFGKKVEHPGTKANPFLARAVENSADEVQKYFQEAVEKVAKL